MKKLIIIVSVIALFAIPISYFRYFHVDSDIVKTAVHKNDIRDQNYILCKWVGYTLSGETCPRWRVWCVCFRLFYFAK